MINLVMYQEVVGEFSQVHVLHCLHLVCSSYTCACEVNHCGIQKLSWGWTQVVGLIMPCKQFSRGASAPYISLPLPPPHTHSLSPFPLSSLSLSPLSFSHSLMVAGYVAEELLTTSSDVFSSTHASLTEVYFPSLFS